jgi:hypothetical protein
MRFLFTILICLSSFFILYGQEIEYRGIVVDSASFSALPYVSVQVKNSPAGTSTDRDGNFKIKASPRDTLIISYIGYNTMVLPLYDYEASVILLAEHVTVLDEVTFQVKQLDPYAGMFVDEQARLLDRNNPFYLSKAKKEKRKVGWLREDNLQAQTYVDIIIKNAEVKDQLMKRYRLSEDQYYHIMGNFNASHYTMMYYLTPGELISLVNTYFEKHANEKR